jgi:hypothetical protein
VAENKSCRRQVLVGLADFPLTYPFSPPVYNVQYPNSKVEAKRTTLASYISSSMPSMKDMQSIVKIIVCGIVPAGGEYEGARTIRLPRLEIATWLIGPPLFALAYS